MSGSLAPYLQAEFARALDRDWHAQKECPLFGKDSDLQRKLGFNPHFDLLLTHRVLLEFEVSRADPVANHAKVAVAHLHAPLGDRDVFVSMMSAHIDAGRRNLGAHTIGVLRRIGVAALQTPLLAGRAAAEIKRLNHLPKAELLGERPDVGPDVARLLRVAVGAEVAGGHRIHFAGNAADVVLNVWAWNLEAAGPSARQWLTRAGGKRSSQFFVQVGSGQFAPAKFCAFMPVGGREMAMPFAAYTALDESESRFDGHIARRHVASIGYREVPLDQHPDLRRRFDAWHSRVAGLLTVMPEPVVLQGGP